MKKLLLTLAAILATSVCVAQDSIQLKRSDELFADGVELYKQGKYLEAIPYFTEADAIDKAERDTLDGMRYYSEVWLASCYYKTGDEEKAKKTHDYYKLEPVDRREMADLEERLFICEKNNDENCKLHQYEEYLDVLTRTIGKDNYKFLEILLKLSLSKFALNENGSEELIETKSYFNDERYKKTNLFVLYYAVSFFKFSQAGDKGKAIKILKEAEKIELSTYQMMIMYEEMLIIASQKMEKFKEYNFSRNLALKGISILENNDIHSSYYLGYFNLLIGSSYMSEKNYASASEWMIKSIEEFDKISDYMIDVNPSLYASIVNMTVNVFYQLKDIEKANYYANKFIKITKSIPELQDELIEFCTIWVLNTSFTQPMASVGYCMSAMDILKDDREKMDKYYFFFSMMVMCYFDAGHLDTAKSLAVENLNSSREKTHGNSLAYAYALTAYSYVFSKGDKENNDIKSILNEYIDAALAIYENNGMILNQLQQPNEDNFMCFMAGFLKNNLQGWENFVDVPQSGNNAGKSNISRVTDVVSEISQVLSYTIKGNYKQAIEIADNLLGGNQSLSIKLILKLCMVFCYSNLGNQNKISKMSKEVIADLKEYIDRELMYMTSFTKMNAWEGNKGIFGFMYAAALVGEYNEELLRACYDFTLICKGVLMNTDFDVKNILLESDNPTLIAEYNDMMMSRELRDNQLKLKGNDCTINLDSLINKINIQEEFLMNKLIELDYNIEREYVTWRDVRDALDEKDIAIEFVKFGDWYCAIYVTKKLENPGLRLLFKEEKITSLSKDKYYTKDELFNIVWRPLLYKNHGGEYYAKNIDNVYFSADGILNQIAIENAPYKLDSTFYYPSNMHRLSSTRELVHKNGRANLNKTVLYGGIEYEADGQTIAAANAEKAVKNTKTSDEIQNMLTYESGTRSVTDSLDVRGAMNYLLGTLEEVEAISNTLTIMSNDTMVYKTDVYTDIYATEESFRNLSGTDVSTLHIATHGFFYTQTEAERQKENEKSMQFVVDGDNVSYEDKAMTRSGLMLAGAASSLRGDPSREQVEDGILTAMEISQLDLRNVDMVVLSACETGLGDISADGVFGLQRGFKKAGVKTIVMSLWKVDDEATRIFMDAFYRQLSSGQSKREAFNIAQYVLRHDSDGKYSDPKYWAAFIMLD